MEGPLDRDLREKVEWIALVFPRTVRAMQGAGLESDPTNLTVSQWDALFVLEDREPCSLSELTKALGITQSSSSELIDRLVKAGYVEREPKPENRRMLSLKLTEAARQLVGRRKEALFSHFKEAISRLSPEDQAELLSAFQKIFNMMHKLKDRMPDSYGH
jgi:DNA-binding MarR family transcriptional regulator